MINSSHVDFDAQKDLEFRSGNVEGRLVEPISDGVLPHAVVRVGPGHGHQHQGRTERRHRAVRSARLVISHFKAKHTDDDEEEEDEDEDDEDDDDNEDDDDDELEEGSQHGE